jgi:hypothetical protein
MKKSSLLTLILCLWFCQCQKESAISVQEKIRASMLGPWKLFKMTDNDHHTYTNSDPCFADDTIDFADESATISQGSCIEFPDKDATIKFNWNFISEDVVDMGGDTVKIIQYDDTSLVFKRDDPQYLEYHWFRAK